jgi:hypothetical protein
MSEFEAFEYEPAYEVHVGPEYPPAGEWPFPYFCFGRNGRLIEEFEFDSARWGVPLLMRVEPLGGEPWIGNFAAGGLGVVRGVFATPSSSHVCVVVDGLAFVVDVYAPAQDATLAIDAVVSVVPVGGAPVLLLATETSLAGIGHDGTVWTSPRIVLDSLRVIRAGADAVVCSGEVATGRMATITITPRTGEVWGSDYR